MLSVETASGAAEGYERPQSKCFQFGDCTVALYSGVAAYADDIRQTARSRLGDQIRYGVREVADALGRASVKFFRARFQRDALDPIARTIKTLHSATSGLDADLTHELRYEYRQANTGCDWIVAGINELGPQLYYVTNRGTVQPRTDEDFLAIGEGAEIAAYKLRRIPHQRARFIGATLFDVYSAKRSAEVVHSVGREWITVITVDSTGCRYAGRMHTGVIRLAVEYKLLDDQERERASDPLRLSAIQDAGRLLLKQAPLSEDRANRPNQAAAPPSTPATKPNTSTSDQT